MNPVVIIPSRFASTRLPGKALADINGRAMIDHVVDRALETNLGPVVVASDDERILDAVKPRDVTPILTSEDHISGSDRIYEALEAFDAEKTHDVVVNFQGDLPTIDSKSVRSTCALLSDASVDIATMVAVITEQAELAMPSVVKTAISIEPDGTSGRCLYFSRNPIPANEGAHYHHIGLYVFRRNSLEKFVALPPGVLETREKLEQLRALENGMRIDGIVVDDVPIGVDTPEDLNDARRLLENK